MREPHKPQMPCGNNLYPGNGSFMCQYICLLQLSLQIYLSISMSIYNRHHLCTYLKNNVARTIFLRDFHIWLFDAVIEYIRQNNEIGCFFFSRLIVILTKNNGHIYHLIHPARIVTELTTASGETMR